MRKEIILFVFLAFFCTHSTTNSAADGKWVAEDEKIRELLKRGECAEANWIVKDVRIKDNLAIQLPEWTYQIMNCNKTAGFDYSGDQVEIDEYFQRRFDSYLKQKMCAEAERYMGGIDQKYYSHNIYTYSKWKFTIARCYESVDQRKSMAIYRQLSSKHPTMYEVKFRINFLTGDRSWIYPNVSTVINGVKGALRNKDIKALERLASKSFFLYGFEESLRPKFFDDEMMRFLEKKFKASTILVGETEAKSKELYMLRVVFTDEEYPFWYFMVEQQDGGWQWTGIMISNVSRDQPTTAPRIKKGP